MPAKRLLLLIVSAACLAVTSCGQKPKARRAPAPPPQAKGAPASPERPAQVQAPAKPSAAPAAAKPQEAPAPVSTPPKEQPPEEPLELYGMILDGLKSDNIELRAVSVDAAVALPGEGIARWLMERFSGARPSIKALMLNIFARRCERSSLKLVLEALKDSDESVRAAAAEALASLGGRTEVPELAKMLASANQLEREASRKALLQLRGEGVDAAISNSLKDASVEVKRALLGVLAARQAESELEAVLAACSDPAEPVRIAALEAMAVLADAERFPQALEFILKATSDAERASAEKAAQSTLQRATSRTDCEGPALEALGRATGPAKGSLLRLLSRVGSPKALEAVRKATGDPDPAVQDAAVRALADWPNTSAMQAALELAKGAQKETHRVLALRGYLRMLGMGGDRSASETLKLYEEAMKVAKRPEDKKLVLAGVSGLAHPGALKMAESFIKDQTLGAEAAMAALKIAIAMCGSYRTDAEAALKRLAESAPDERVRGEASRALEQIGNLADFILSWYVAGPYTEKNKEGHAIFDVPFPPERNDKDVVWRRQPLRPELDRLWSINLHATMQGDNRAGYLKTKIWSPSRQDAVLEIGSDDGVKVWLNGKVVHANNALRGERQGEDKVRVTLEQGSNLLMLKVTNDYGDWAANVRLRAPDGSSLKGVRVSAD